MRAFFIGLLCLILWTSVARYIYVCQIKNQCQSTTAVDTSNLNRVKNLGLVDGNTTILEGYEHFIFLNKSISPELSIDNHDYLDGIAAFLKNNPDKNLKITGFFRPSEEGMQDGIYENLGLARANVIKDLLIQRGIDKERLFLDYNSAEETLSNPLAFSLFSAIPTESDATDEERLTNARYSFDNMVFSDANFESSSAIFRPSQAFINWADSVKVYFELNPNQTLQIIGHTDKTGSDKYNRGLGAARAKAAKAYFQELGVQAAIATSSMGEKQPIATNRTKKGRQKNRRVNFIIK